ncbi:hypothetical protein Scep_020221 [Stephania cephalantha]|uniref:Uncharacterized protein n=1 Tax=Stephania cephalantha TaxID=152367 RepID=A0AAP0NM79_9MAGN
MKPQNPNTRSVPLLKSNALSVLPSSSNPMPNLSFLLQSRRLRVRRGLRRWRGTTTNDGERRRRLRVRRGHTGRASEAPISGETATAETDDGLVATSNARRRISVRESLTVSEIPVVVMMPDVGKVELPYCLRPVKEQTLDQLIKIYGGIFMGASLAMVMQLRKTCSHPYLFLGIEPEPYVEGEHLVQHPQGVVGGCGDGVGPMVVISSYRNICMNQHRNQRRKSLFPSLIPLLIRNGIRDGNNEFVSDSVETESETEFTNLLFSSLIPFLISNGIRDGMQLQMRPDPGSGRFVLVSIRALGLEPWETLGLIPSHLLPSCIMSNQGRSSYNMRETQEGDERNWRTEMEQRMTTMAETYQKAIHDMRSAQDQRLADLAQSQKRSMACILELMQQGNTEAAERAPLDLYDLDYFTDAKFYNRLGPNVS